MRRWINGVDDGGVTQDGQSFLSYFVDSCFHALHTAPHHPHHPPCTCFSHLTSSTPAHLPYTLRTCCSITISTPGPTFALILLTSRTLDTEKRRFHGYLDIPPCLIPHHSLTPCSGLYHLFSLALILVMFSQAVLPLRLASR